MWEVSKYFNVIFSVHLTVQEGQTISPDILPDELDVAVHCTDVFYEVFLLFPSFALIFTQVSSIF